MNTYLLGPCLMHQDFLILLLTILVADLLFSILSNRTLIVQPNCQGRPCIDDWFILKPRPWANDIQNTTSFIQQKAQLQEYYAEWLVDDEGEPSAPFPEKETVIRVGFRQNHYNFTDWDRIFRRYNRTQNNGTILIELFAQGIHFLYGMLFHRLFTFREHCEQPWGEFPPKKLVLLDLPEIRKTTNTRVSQCLDTLVSAKTVAKKLTSHTCHIFVMTSKDATINWTDDSFGEDSCHNCSFSWLPVYDEDNYSDGWWKFLDLVSLAHSGWISFKQDVLSRSSDPTTSLVKEWIEYKRYLETWKMGREPFIISEFPVCFL